MAETRFVTGRHQILQRQIRASGHTSKIFHSIIQYNVDQLVKSLENSSHCHTTQPFAAVSQCIPSKLHQIHGHSNIQHCSSGARTLAASLELYTDSLVHVFLQVQNILLPAPRLHKSILTQPYSHCSVALHLPSTAAMPERFGKPSHPSHPRKRLGGVSLKKRQLFVPIVEYKRADVVNARTMPSS